MIYAKTQAGQLALRDRRDMTVRQRTAFILFDGKRTGQEVKAATGIADVDVEQLLRKGFLTALPGPDR